MIEYHPDKKYEYHDEYLYLELLSNREACIYLAKGFFQKDFWHSRKVEVYITYLYFSCKSRYEILLYLWKLYSLGHAHKSSQYWGAFPFLRYIFCFLWMEVIFRISFCQFSKFFLHSLYKEERSSRAICYLSCKKYLDRLLSIYSIEDAKYALIFSPYPASWRFFCPLFSSPVFSYCDHIFRDFYFTIFPRYCFAPSSFCLFLFLFLFEALFIHTYEESFIDDIHDFEAYSFYHDHRFHAVKFRRLEFCDSMHECRCSFALSALDF